MRKLTKLPSPVWLEENQIEKTRQYIAAPEGRKPRPWIEGKIPDTLRQESQKKCMYCECMIDDGAYSAVEHIKPRDKFPDLVLEWDNLGLACTRCNTNKSNYWTDEECQQLLNPYIDDISEHVEFAGPLTVARLSSPRAKNTLRQLKFAEREDLFMSRLRRIEELDSRLRVWAGAASGELKELLAQDVREAIDHSREFSSVLRSYASVLGFEDR